MKYWLVVLGVFCCLSAWGAGPTKVASYDRSLWPEAIDSSVRFDNASLYENLMFVSVLAETPTHWEDTELKSFTGLKKVDLKSATIWRQRTQAWLLQNLRLIYCQNRCDLGWGKAISLAQTRLSQLAPEYLPWSEAARGFYHTYLYEQLRLAALFPRISSEILPLSAQENLGQTWRDGEFLLSFDDGPSRNKARTQSLIHWLNKAQFNGVFFVLGERLQSRLKADKEAISALYQSQCLGSHGYTHSNHAKALNWQDSLEQTHALIQNAQPDAPGVYRPPYGQRTSEQVVYLAQQSHILMLWNIDSQDWNAKLSAQAVANRMEALMLLWRRGTLLFHDIHAKALPAVQHLSGLLKAKGGRWLDCNQAIARLREGA